MSKGYFSYIRVSTVRQGQTGTSLTEQHEAIQRYASRWNLRIVKEFEEKETAAQSGRPVFHQMLRLLKRQEAAGLIIHKIDRSARNLRDWAELGDLIDSGVEIHFANENLDLESRGGRLSADIQAVVAADYIRNLREEVKKGFYGRLKQGFYPMRAPIGYLDRGSGTPKEPDPIQAVQVKDAFELYATGRYGIDDLVEIMYARGLRSKTGGKVTRNGLSHLLHNCFYSGLIHVKIKDEIFAGRHQPIVSKSLFDQVQRVFLNRHVKRELKHQFLFRRMLRCDSCQSTLIAEKQKGYVYYRCHKSPCGEKTVREEVIEASISDLLKQINLGDAELLYLKRDLAERYESKEQAEERRRDAVALQLQQARARRSHLTDVYLEGGVLDRETYIEKKNQLVSEEQTLSHRIANLGAETAGIFSEVEQILELANNAYLSYEMASADEKRKLIKSVTSNLAIKQKTVLYKLNYPFQLIVNRYHVAYGRPHRDTPRNLSRLVSQLVEYFRSRKNKDEDEDLEKPVKPVSITEHRLRLAFRRANGVDQDQRAA